MSDQSFELRKTEESLIKHPSGATFAQAELVSLMKYINDVMRHLAQENAASQEKANDENATPDFIGALLSGWEAFNEDDNNLDAEYNNFFSKFSDGVLLSLLLYNANPAIIDLNAVEPNQANTFKVMENNRRIIQSAKNMGLVVVNVDAQQLVDAKPTPILSLLSQIMRLDFTNCIRVNNTIQMINLKRSEESIRTFLELDPKELILRWVNFVLSTDNASSSISVTNISSDFKNSVAYMHLLRNIAPNVISEEDVQQILGIEDLRLRAQGFINKLEKLKLSRRIFLTPSDITTGKLYMNLALIGSIFNDYGIMSLSDHFDMDPQEMLDLRCQILDNTVEALEKEMPEVRSSEFASFVAAAKSLSKATKSDDSNKTGVLSELKNVQATASGLQNKMEQLKVEYEEKNQQLVVQHEERTKELQSEFEAALVRMKVEQEAAIERLMQEKDEEISKLKTHYEEQLDEMKSRMMDMQLSNEILTAELKTEKDLLESIKKSTKKESDHSLEEKLNLRNEILALREKYVQTKKDLIYVMNSIIGDFQAEVKLATWKFGSIKIQDLTKRCSMQGFIKKRSNGVVKNWKNRYWVLVDNYIFYFEDQKDNSKLKGILRLDECKVAGYDRFSKSGEKIGDDDAPGFVIFTAKRKMKTQVSSPEEALQWKKAIMEAGNLKL